MPPAVVVREFQMTDPDNQGSRFLATLAHELRNPLAPIRNALNLIQMTDPSPAPEHAEHLAIIDRQVNHLVRLVDDLLDISRLREGKIRLQKEIVDIAAVVKSALETVQPLVAARHQHLTVSIPDEPLI